MRILNESQGKIISENAEITASFSGRLRGLMLSEPKDLVLQSPKEDVLASAIHMAFMRYPLDVIWLDSKFCVVDIMLKVPAMSIYKPSTWKTYKPRNAAKYVVELGISAAVGVVFGDKFAFQKN